jgi:ribonuclease HI
MGIDTTNLVIWQQNVNKSPASQHDLISSKSLIEEEVSIVALQEPALNHFDKTIATKDWTPIYPSTHNEQPKLTRSILLVRSALTTDSWKQLDFPSGDVTVVQLKGNWGKMTIFNVYNDCEHNQTIIQLANYQQQNSQLIEDTEIGNAHRIWLGDFNRHHPCWDNSEDKRLFTKAAEAAATVLIDAVAGAGLIMALPKGIPTHRHNVTKKWTRIDQVFLSDHSLDTLITCDTVPDRRGICTDHLPILTKLNLEAMLEPATIKNNYRAVDWEQFRNTLSSKLTRLSLPSAIGTQPQLDKACSDLTTIIQETIEEKVPTTKICAKSKRWWTTELTMLRREANKLGRVSYNHKDKPFHFSHAAHADADKLYHRTLKSTKLQHWRDWLENADDPDIWTVQKLLASPASDGGGTRIPVLKYKEGDTPCSAISNADKGRVLAKSFFPSKPPQILNAPQTDYPPQCEKASQLTKDSITRQLSKLKPYKAPGPDGIPNIVLTKCANLLVDRLYHIFTAIYNKKLYYKPWKCFNTIVLRKPGKASYDIPKAYRPIALINTMWKVLTAILAEQLTFFAEKHRLLPDHHFGGRLGRTTMDAMHLLTYRIKGAWRKGQVASVLFLDIEGAFPNAVPPILIHNLRKRRIPSKLIDFTIGLLNDRVTTLKFDDFASDPFPVDNGIGQGDPLSMALYQFYNADLLDIPTCKDEDSIAYVDDALLLAIADDFTKTHSILADMMTRETGVINWSKSHNSPLENSKLALIDFAHQNNSKQRPNLTLPHITIEPTTNAKYLGVIFDQHLKWSNQHAHVTGKGLNWASQIRRATRPSWGITPKYARRLYISVALPKVLYAIDVWCIPLHGTEAGPKKKGSVNVIKKLTTIQRAGALAITGGLRTSPTDALDACAYTIPVDLIAEKWCHKAAVRLATLPPVHPLFKPIRASANGNIRRHKAPLHSLMQLFEINPKETEKIAVAVCNPMDTNKIPLRIDIANDKAESKASSQRASEVVKVYTDGSVHDNKVGAAAILTRSGHQNHVLHYHLGRADQHNNYEAELSAILLGLHLIKTEKAGNTSFALGADNQAALKAIKSDLIQSGQHIIEGVLRTVLAIRNKRNAAKYSLTFRWTAGHVGIAGNELADKEAKCAANGTSSDKKLLPTLLRRKLKINSAALKTDHHEKIMKNWKKRWRKSARGSKMVTLDNTTPSKIFLNAISDTSITREASSILSQLRMGHIPLNGYLYKFKLVDSPRCPACGAAVETIHHFLIRCPSYAHERWPLTEKLGRPPTEQDLLADHKLTKHLLYYIEATGRFKQRGEYVNPDK